MTQVKSWTFSPESGGVGCGRNMRPRRNQATSHFARLGRVGLRSFEPSKRSEVASQSPSCTPGRSAGHLYPTLTPVRIGRRLGGPGRHGPATQSPQGLRRPSFRLAPSVTAARLTLDQLVKVRILGGQLKQNIRCKKHLRLFLLVDTTHRSGVGLAPGVARSVRNSGSHQHTAPPAHLPPGTSACGTQTRSRAGAGWAHLRRWPPGVAGPRRSSVGWRAAAPRLGNQGPSRRRAGQLRDSLARRVMARPAADCDAGCRFSPGTIAYGRQTGHLLARAGQVRATGVR